MSVLSDRDIRKYLSGEFIEPNPRCTVAVLTRVIIDPLDETQIQPASIDLKLAPEFRRYDFKAIRSYSEALKLNSDFIIDLDNKGETTTQLIEDEKYILEPDEFILGSTIERVEIPDNLCARVEGKSSLGRLGLLIHATAGYIDPGFKGKITLEIKNLNNRPIILRAGKPVCQLSLTELSSPAEFPYGHTNLNSKYQNQDAVTASKYQG